MNEKVQKFIISILDIFYPLFKPFFNKQTYYYLACGGGNTVFALVLYYIFYNNLLHQEDLDLYIITFKAHMASLFLTTAITFPIGFYLTKFIVWSDSNLETKKQFFRHFAFLVFGTVLNYFLLKLFVETLEWWAMPSQILTTVIIVIFSYLTQKYISFKKVN
jgi:putative flippase GtrA